VSDTGPGTVLLLHGQPGGARDWAQVLATIRDAVPTIALDRPGWDGLSPATDLRGNAEHAIAALDAHGLDRATVVGHSFGGAVAAWLAAHHPERVSSLVLAAPSANGESLYALDRWLAAPLSGYLASAALLGAVGAVLKAGLSRRRIASRLALEESYLLAAGRNLLTPAAWRAFAVEQRALIADMPALEASLGRITAPTRVVIGSTDRIVPPDSARRLAGQIPGAELVVLDRASHLLPLQHSERLAQLILEANRAAGTGRRG
jgi:pimeloyl-ACP methyl ester carboxylesterase